MDYELMMNGTVKIGQRAPDFTAETTYGPVCLDDYKGKWLVLFSHPGDFTPVCTTEMIAFAQSNSYFEKLNTALLGLSIDSNPSHLAWMHDIYRMTGIVLPFPIIADRNGEIARKYGMISNDISTGDMTYPEDYPLEGATTPPEDELDGYVEIVEPLDGDVEIVEPLDGDVEMVEPLEGDIELIDPLEGDVAYPEDEIELLGEVPFPDMEEITE